MLGGYDIKFVHVTFHWCIYMHSLMKALR